MGGRGGVGKEELGVNLTRIGFCKVGNWWAIGGQEWALKLVVVVVVVVVGKEGKGRERKEES